MHVMTFWWGDKIEEFVFGGISTNTPWSLTFLCVSLICLCLVYEAIKLHQAKVRLSSIKARFKLISCQPPNESATLLSASELAQQRLNTVNQASTSTTATQPSPRVIFQDPSSLTSRCMQVAKEALIFFIQAVLGYFIMLAVMTYNGPVFIAVTLGMALGYFLFGHFTMGLNWESTKMHHTTFKCSTNCPNGGKKL